MQNNDVTSVQDMFLYPNMWLGMIRSQSEESAVSNGFDKSREFGDGFPFDSSGIGRKTFLIHGRTFNSYNIHDENVIAKNLILHQSQVNSHT